MHKAIASICLIFSFATVFAAQEKLRITREDLSVLEGDKWTGSLSYLDYGSNKTVTIRSNLMISRSPSDPSTWVFTYEYPDEPKANRASEVKLTGGGTVFDGEAVVERHKLRDGSLRFTTTSEGTDNNRKAVFRYTYVLSKTRFTVTKEVRIDGGEKYFTRNSSDWSR